MYISIISCFTPVIFTSSINGFYDSLSNQQSSADTGNNSTDSVNISHAIMHFTPSQIQAHEPSRALMATAASFST